MMNSGATLLTFDFYRKYVDPDASERKLIRVGRLCIVAFVLIAACIAAVIYTEEAADNFFLKVPAQMGHVVPGIAVAFLGGVLWRRASAEGAFWALLASPFFSFGVQWLYGLWAPGSAVEPLFGAELNFLHRTALTSAFALAILVWVSSRDRSVRADTERLTWWGRPVAQDGKVRSFWASERPWGWLLGAATVFMLVYFA